MLFRPLNTCPDHRAGEGHLNAVELERMNGATCLPAVPCRNGSGSGPGRGETD